MSFVVDQQRLARAIPKAIRELCEQIRDSGFGVWCVGGAVRDVILSQARDSSELPNGDWDIASSATPDQISRIFRKVIPSGIEHGTVTVLWRDREVEVTTLRGECGYVDGRHPTQVVFLNSIDDDLARRDFTVNAIAYDPIHDEIVDPHGGVADIQARCIRAVGDPLARFSEDGLRVLRAARFSATLDMQVDSDTLAAIRPSLDSFRKVSMERVRDEWTKSLKARQPSRAFRIIHDHGLLQITAPELAQTQGCAQNRYHRFDVWEHTLRTLDRVPPNSLVLRLAALLHDIGKPSTRAVHPQTGDNTFYGHEIVGANMADALMRRLRFSNDLRDQVTALVRHHIVAYESNWTDAAVRRWTNRVGSQRVSDILELARADVTAKGQDAAPQIRDLVELDRRIKTAIESNHALCLKDLRISGSTLVEELNLLPGPMIGVLLRALLEDVLEVPEHNEREHLLGRARELLDSQTCGTK
jgi:tRNA nucleotidyltransferase (CCA-adding enzyme)